MEMVRNELNFELFHTQYPCFEKLTEHECVRYFQENVNSNNFFLSDILLLLLLLLYSQHNIGCPAHKLTSELVFKAYKKCLHFLNQA